MATLQVEREGEEGSAAAGGGGRCLRQEEVVRRSSGRCPTAGLEKAEQRRGEAGEGFGKITG